MFHESSRPMCNRLELNWPILNKFAHHLIDLRLEGQLRDVRIY